MMYSALFLLIITSVSEIVSREKQHSGFYFRATTRYLNKYAMMSPSFRIELFLVPASAPRLV